MKVYNSSKNNLVADKVFVADNFVTRTIGLISKKEILEGEGMVIKPCCSIHTFFMRFDIDVLFVNKKNEVVAVYENVKPNRVLPIHFNSEYVIELPAGGVSSKNIQKGDLLNMI